MSEKVILGFQIPKEKEQQIEELCRLEKISWKKVDKTESEKTMGALAGIPGIPANASPEVNKMDRKTVNQEMLVFSGLTQEELDHFLKEYRNRGIQTVALKAMVTMYNIFWTPEVLFAEISREHEEMTKKAGNIKNI